MVVTGIGGAFSVVAANSWMNQPQGFTLDAAGKVVDIDPLKVLFNPATGYEVPHMILAAYMVVGFLVASIYAVGMLKGRRDRLHRLGLLIPLTIACIATPIQLFVGDTAAREVADHQPAKFAAMECIQETGGHQTEYVGGICTADGVKCAIPIPDLDSFLVGFSADTKVTGLNDIPDDERPPANTLLHLAFDAMVGIGTALLLLGVWLALVWWKKRDIPQTPWFLRAVAVSGGGRDPGPLVRLDRDRGRAPAVDRPGLHADRGSGHRGRRDLVHLRPDPAALRGDRDDRDPRPAADVAALARRRAPNPTAPPTRRRAEAAHEAGGDEQGRRRGGDPLGRGDLLRALRRRRLRRRLLGPDRRRRRAGASGRGR